MIKKILLVLLAAFIFIQFFRPEKNITATTSSNDIALHYAIPENVKNILKKSCYDCHSNNSVYPWYNNVQPVAWWLANHISDGKRELNFNEFFSYAPKKQYRKLRKSVSELKEGEMPLNSYLWIHKDAILDSGQKDLVIRWADSLSSDIKIKNNLPDEPEKRREP